MRWYRRFGVGRFFAGSCYPCGHGPSSFPHWHRNLNKDEETRLLEEYAEDLKVELEEVEKEIEDLKKK